MLKDIKSYFAAKAVIMHKLEKRSQSRTGHLSDRLSDYARYRSQPAVPIDQPNISPEALGQRLNEFPRPNPTTKAELQTMQALIITIEMTSWADTPVVHEALSLASHLATLVREAGISQPDEIPEGTAWLVWIKLEEWRRTIFVAYVLFGLHSITFNLPPMSMNHEIALCLPHCNSEWRATSSAEWGSLRQKYGHDERFFQEALSELMNGREVHRKGPLSAFGNCVLIYGLLQQISLEKHTGGFLSNQSLSLKSDLIKQFELALQTWQKSWEATEESCLDPSSLNGTIGFDSAALLRLAYIRLNADSRLQRSLVSGHPDVIAKTFTNGSACCLTRSAHMDRAVLQCIHAFSIPIRLGIAFIARTQTSNWSIQHSLCNLEGAFLLGAWLNCLANIVDAAGFNSLTKDERKLLGILASLIRETEYAEPLETYENDANCIRRMAVTAFKLWAETFKGLHVFQVVHTIGESLSRIADALEAR